MHPFNLAVGVLGPCLAAIDSHLLWALPITMTAYGGLVVWRARTSAMLPADPLAAAGSPLDWAAERRALESPDARGLLERLEQIECRATFLARTAPTGTQGVLIAALAQIREVARTGAALARAIDRLEGVVRLARSERARAEAQSLRERALAQSDPVAAELLLAAANQRAAHARRADDIATLRERAKAEGEELLAQLERAALSAEWAAARPAVCERVRIDVSVVRETLAELESMDLHGAEAIARAYEPLRPDVREVPSFGALPRGA